MTKESALSIIQASLPPGATMKFHSDSRKPFDYEQPVIDAAMEALGGKGFTKTCTMTNDDFHLSVENLIADFDNGYIDYEEYCECYHDLLERFEQGGEV